LPASICCSASVTAGRGPDRGLICDSNPGCHHKPLSMDIAIGGSMRTLTVRRVMSARGGRNTRPRAHRLRGGRCSAPRSAPVDDMTRSCSTVQRGRCPTKRAARPFHCQSEKNTSRLSAVRRQRPARVGVHVEATAQPLVSPVCQMSCCVRIMPPRVAACCRRGPHWEYTMLHTVCGAARRVTLFLPYAARIVFGRSSWQTSGSIGPENQHTPPRRPGGAGRHRLQQGTACGSNIGTPHCAYCRCTKYRASLRATCTAPAWRATCNTPGSPAGVPRVRRAPLSGDAGAGAARWHMCGTAPGPAQ
jgi:hypothetical protein